MHGIDYVLIILLALMLFGAVKLMRKGRSCCGGGSSCSCNASGCSSSASGCSGSSGCSSSYAGSGSGLNSSSGRDCKCASKIETPYSKR